jgi:hypothetical protein
MTTTKIGPAELRAARETRAAAVPKTKIKAKAIGKMTSIKVTKKGRRP